MGIQQLGLLGSNINNSISAKVHNRFFAKMGIKAEYKLYNVHPSGENLAEFIANLKQQKPFLGLSVTAPFKQSIIPLLDKLDPTAKKIGAVNTVLKQNGKLLGYNTDWYGVKHALVKNYQTALVIGAGGASRAIIYALKELKTKVLITNRSHNNAKKLAGEFNCKAVKLDEIKDYFSQVDLIINATSLENIFTLKAIKPEYITQQHTVFDVLNKQNTATIQIAKTRGASVILGSKMWLYQALGQYAIWFE